VGQVVSARVRRDQGHGVVRAGAGGTGGRALLLPEIGELRRGQRVALLGHLVFARRRGRGHPPGHIAIAPAAGQVALTGSAPGSLVVRWFVGWWRPGGAVVWCGVEWLGREREQRHGLGVEVVVKVESKVRGHSHWVV